jgi:hypothetical protein
MHARAASSQSILHQKRKGGSVEIFCKPLAGKKLGSKRSHLL